MDTSSDRNTQHSRDGAGILLQTIRPGDGINVPRKGDICKVHFDGFLEDGTKFDSSRAWKHPLAFRLGTGQVIEGWDAAVARMSRGQIARVTIPPLFGYGTFGYDPIVPPNATLIFEIELLSFGTAGSMS